MPPQFVETLGKEKQMDAATPNWRALQIYNIYRFFLSLIFISIYQFNLSPLFLENFSPRAFIITSLSFAILACFSLITATFKKGFFSANVLINVIIDIIVLSFIVYASGGVNTGLGMLMIFSITCGTFLVPGKASIVFAAFAAISILLEETILYTLSRHEFLISSQLTLLILSFFATTLLAHTLGKKVRSTEALARERGMQLAALAKLNEQIIKRMLSGVIVINQNNHIALINQAAWSLLGYPAPLKEKNIHSISAPIFERLNFWKSNPLLKSTPFQANRNSPLITVEFHHLDSNKNKTLITLFDAAQLAERAQAIKLNSLARLTASIAHEIRNPLSAINHAAQLLEEIRGLKRQDVRLIEIIKNNCQQTNHVIETVLQISRRKQPNHEALFLQDWLPELFEKTQIMHFDKKHLFLDLPKNLSAIAIDPHHLTQVLINLCENAIRYSLEKTGSPILIVKARQNSSTKQVTLDIIDKGRGINNGNRQYIFEPFYTTETQGTGLGLYITKELCEANEIKIEHIAYEPGCCFRISFSKILSLTRTTQEINA